MDDNFKVFVGVDWASEEHEVCALDREGKQIAARAFKHSGDGLAELCVWLAEMGSPEAIAVAIEVPPQGMAPGCAQPMLRMVPWGPAA
jgi:hypothetical protein